jgi:hypothetical protein
MIKTNGMILRSTRNGRNLLNLSVVYCRLTMLGLQKNALLSLISMPFQDKLQLIARQCVIDIEINVSPELNLVLGHNVEELLIEISQMFRFN